MNPFTKRPEIYNVAFTSVNQLSDASCARSGRNLTNLFAHERVDEAALARFDLSDNDDHRRGLQISQASSENFRGFVISASFSQPECTLKMAPECLKLTLQFGTENLCCCLRAFTARFRLPLFQLAHVGVIISPRLFSAHRKFAKIAIQ